MAEVVLIRWPEDGGDGLRLAGTGVAVLYLVDGDGEPPSPTTCLEDWVRIPGDERDIRSRIEALEVRTLLHQTPPRVDADGRLHYRGKVTVLPVDQVDLARRLTERLNDVVPDSELAVLARGPVQRKTAQLRAQLREVGLSVRRVRRRGYTLEEG